jgi:hypothetical protein
LECDEFKGLQKNDTDRNFLRLISRIFLDRDPTDEDLEYHIPRQPQPHCNVHG